MGGVDSVPEEERRDALACSVGRYKTLDAHEGAVWHRVMLMQAPHLIDFEDFYEHTSASKLRQYFIDVGPMTVNQAKTVVNRIMQSCKQSDAIAKLRQVLPVLRIKTKNRPYLSPGTDKKLFSQVVKETYATSEGQLQVGNIIDWDSDEVRMMREEQMNDTEEVVQRHCLNDDAGIVAVANPMTGLWEGDVKDTFTGFKKMPKRMSFRTWRPKIHLAAEKGDISSVQYCLQTFPLLLNLPNVNGDTPAHCAARKGEVKMLKFLKGAGALFDLYNNDGWMVVHTVGRSCVVKEFGKLGMTLDSRSRECHSLLDIRTLDGDKKMVACILNRDFNIFEPSPKGVYWMQLALKEKAFCGMGRKKWYAFVRGIIVKRKKAPYATDKILIGILKRKVKMCIKEDKNDLNDAVERNDIPRARVLMALGARADKMRSDFRTNLALCAEEGHHELLRMLCSNFANVHITNEPGENMVWVAAMAGHFESVRVLMEFGVDVNEHSSNGSTVLHAAYARKKQRKEDPVFDFLLDVGANPNEKNREGKSVLFIALCDHNDQITEKLQDKYNGDINTRDPSGNTVGHLEVAKLDSGRVEYLIDRGIDIEAKNNNGKTMFHIAMVDTENEEMCKMLLSHSADINTIDKLGDSALIAILNAKVFLPWKFNFLIEESAGVNIKNAKGEYAISVCILREFREYGTRLLNMECRINDENAAFEPIVCALMKKDQTWFENLLAKGANALNVKYPVVATYMTTSFFNERLLLGISKLNRVIGAPLQVSMELKMLNITDWLWDGADHATKVRMSAEKDKTGKIPISVAMLLDYEKLVEDMLESDEYEMGTPDNDKRTPLIHAAMLNKRDWLIQIYSKVDLKVVDVIDKSGRPALWYIANNKDFPLCNRFFVDGCNVLGFDPDPHGIIELYQSVVTTYNDLLSNAQQQLDDAKANLAASTEAIARARANHTSAAADMEATRRNAKSASDRLSQISREDNSCGWTSRYDACTVELRRLNDQMIYSIYAVNRAKDLVTAAIDDQVDARIGIEICEGRLVRLRAVKRKTLLRDLDSVRAIVNV